jgi:UDP:flavonoid glycosyltransferase YjiC (YdhE family)
MSSRLDLAVMNTTRPVPPVPVHSHSSVIHNVCVSNTDCQSSTTSIQSNHPTILQSYLSSLVYFCHEWAIQVSVIIVLSSCFSVKTTTLAASLIHTSTHTNTLFVCLINCPMWLIWTLVCCIWFAPMIFSYISLYIPAIYRYFTHCIVRLTQLCVGLIRHIRRRIRVLFVTILLGVSCSSSVVQAAQPHVLFVSIPWRGHVNPLRTMARRLVTRGFAVSFALPDEYRNWVQSDGFNFLSTGSCSHITRSTQEGGTDGQLEPSASSIDALIHTLSAFHECMHAKLHAATQRFRPGLMIVDRFTQVGIDVALDLNVPYIVNSPFFLLESADSMASVALPAPFSAARQLPITLWQRSSAALQHISMSISHCFQLFSGQQTSVSSLWQSLFCGAIHHETVLVNTVFGLEYPRAPRPSVHFTGPILPRTPQYSLLVQLSTLLETAANAGSKVVVVDQGEHQAWNGRVLASLMEAVQNRRFRDNTTFVVLTDSDENLGVRSSPNVALISPEAVNVHALLARPEVSLFVTAGDFTDVHVALASSRPCVVLPVYPEQMEVAARMHRIGVAIVVPVRTSSLEAQSVMTLDLVEAIANVLEDGQSESLSMPAAAERVASLLKHAGGTQQAVGMIELSYDLGTDFLQTQVDRMPWYQRWMLDVYALFIVIVAIVVLLIQYMVHMTMLKQRSTLSNSIAVTVTSELKQQDFIGTCVPVKKIQ